MIGLGSVCVFVHTLVSPLATCPRAILDNQAAKVVVFVPWKTASLQLLISGEESRYLRTKGLRRGIHRDVPLTWHDGDL
jgi:hypothetical protein